MSPQKRLHRGMRSKRITRLEHQLSENIKLTQNRIWSGVTKDVSYLRRILNEIYMLKFKVHDEQVAALIEMIKIKILFFFR